MSFNQESAVERAKADLAKRAGVAESDIETVSVTDEEFPDASLGAPADGDLSIQMITEGWKIILRAGGEDFDYRADKYQLRLSDYKGTNYIIES